MQHPVFYLFCFPPSAAAERSEPSELHDRWTFSALQNALCPASDPEWQDAHPEFPRIVFHGLRHSSATYQLMISGGDITGKPQPAGCARRRRTDHFYDRSAETFEERRPRSKGAAPSGTADLMQNLPRISKQFQPMQRIPTKTPTVQKPCIDRANPEFSGLHNKKERQILRLDVQNLVHLQGLEPWAH